MPAWASATGLRDEEIDRVVAYVRSLGQVQPEPDPKPARWVAGDPAVGEDLFTRHCESCHGAKGIGKEGPALGNRVLLSTATDTYLFETVKRGRRGTTMEGFSRPSPTRPALSDEEIEAVITYLRGLQGES